MGARFGSDGIGRNSRTTRLPSLLTFAAAAVLGCLAFAYYLRALGRIKRQARDLVVDFQVGAAGKGFGVVTDEIRKLAETTAGNVSGIRANLTKIVDGIAEADRLTERNDAAIQEMAKGMRGLASGLDQIHSGLEEMVGGTREISEALTRMKDIVVYATGNNKVSLDLMKAGKVHGIRWESARADGAPAVETAIDYFNRLEVPPIRYLPAKVIPVVNSVPRPPFGPRDPR